MLEPYGGVFDAAGEGNPTPLPAGVVVGAVEVHVEVPVVGPVGPAARPLWREHTGVRTWECTGRLATRREGHEGGGEPGVKGV